MLQKGKTPDTLMQLCQSIMVSHSKIDLPKPLLNSYGTSCCPFQASLAARGRNRNLVLAFALSGMSRPSALT